jgi:tripartite ATP-independent transporter DctM subunit
LASAELSITEAASPASIAERAAIATIEAMAALLLVAMMGLVVIGVVFRYFLSTPIFWIDEVCSILFIWLSMMGAVIAIHRHEHLRLTLLIDRVSPRWRKRLDALGQVLVIAFLATMVLPAYRHVVSESIIYSATLGISNGIRIAAVLFGISAMLLIAFSRLISTASLRRIAVATLMVAGAVAILYASRGLFADLGKLNILIFLVGVLGLCLVIGVPIAFCFGIGTLTFLLFTTRIPASILVGRMDEGMSSLILLSVPVFILLGFVLDLTGMGKVIVDFLASLFGHFRAGMSYVLLGSLYLVSGISGSKVSDMATVAPALFPAMERRGNKPEEMVALLATGAVMADTVPPSIVLIVLGSVAGLSIASLFVSGFVIAFVLLLALAIVARLRGGGDRSEHEKRAPLSVVMTTMKIALPVLFLPLMIRVAVGEGVATATEVSALAVVYALIVGYVFFGGISARGFYRMLVDTAALSGVILLIMGCALAAAWALTQTGFASLLAGFMTDLPGGWISFMLVSIVLFLTLGCLLEGMPALVLLAPLMFPIANGLGIHGIHYAMVAVVAMNIGLFLPPVGIGYYIACSMGRVKPEQAIRPMLIYLGALLAALLLIAFIPAISIAYL